MARTRVNSFQRGAPGVQAVTSASTVTANADTDDLVAITALAANITLANPTGTPSDGQAILFRIKDNATARTVSYGTQFRGIGVTPPATTVISKTLYIPAIYNAADTKWDITGYSQE